jgi:hypothetical protein
MRNLARRIGLAVAALVLVAGMVGRARAGLIHDYELMNTFTDSLHPSSARLVPAGGTLGSTGYTFGPNQGLSVESVIGDGGNYTIDLSFSFHDLSGYRKILDFNNLRTDNGLYVLNSSLDLFGPGDLGVGPAGAFSPDQLVRVDLTRDGTTQLVTGYVDGVSQFSFIDSGSAAVFGAPNLILQFFKDDTSTGGNQASAGFVNQIRIYDSPLSAAEVAALGGPKNPGAVPEPSSFSGFATGILMLLGYAWRRRPRAAA